MLQLLFVYLPLLNKHTETEMFWQQNTENRRIPVHTRRNFNHTSFNKGPENKKVLPDPTYVSWREACHPPQDASCVPNLPGYTLGWSHKGLDTFLLCWWRELEKHLFFYPILTLMTLVTWGVDAHSTGVIVINSTVLLLCKSTRHNHFHSADSYITRSWTSLEL